jgi:membrane-bound serine protease (ClpP class)
MDFSTIDPNLVYLALVFGLWSGVTAAYIMGTGLPETMAMIVLAGSIYVLTQMSTNWMAVLIIMFGISAFMTTPFLPRRFATWALFGLALQSVGGWMLFDDERVSLFVIALTALAPMAYYQFVLIPILDKLRNEPQIEKDDQLVGKLGRVTKALDPTGTVLVNSELWTAIAAGDPITTGENVVVVERNGLQLIVQAAKRKPRIYDNPIEPDEDMTEALNEG